jgi:hypothetical protein
MLRGDSELDRIPMVGVARSRKGSTMDPIKYTLAFERSSKNYHVYRDLSGAMVPDRLYLPQSSLNATPPNTVTITVESDESRRA